LAVANSAAFTVAFALLLYFARRRLGSLDGKRILLDALRVVVAVVASSALLLGYMIVTRSAVTSSSSWVNLFLLLGGFVLFSAITAALYYVLKVEIMRSFLRSRLPRGTKSRLKSQPTNKERSEKR
jgi:peptidoglycan biosynthesis protein MviN/MurJ (putative lipid II flippase)